MDFQYGFDANGIEKLLEEIRGKVITNAANDAVNKLKKVYNIINTEYVENFCKKLKIIFNQ